ncbi:MAG: hypothetical protein IM618_14300 [Cytophagales bacterium]|nr:hypothetical protein [Cytophagales bacterium]
MKQKPDSNTKQGHSTNMLLAEVRLSKREKLASIGAEIYSLKSSNGKHFDATSHLCSVINTLAKGTRFEEEAILIINCVEPEYFNDSSK